MGRVCRLPAGVRNNNRGEISDTLLRRVAGGGVDDLLQAGPRIRKLRLCQVEHLAINPHVREGLVECGIKLTNRVSHDNALPSLYGLKNVGANETRRLTGTGSAHHEDVVVATALALYGNGLFPRAPLNGTGVDCILLTT